MRILARAAAIWVSLRRGDRRLEPAAARKVVGRGRKFMSHSTATTPRVLVVEDEYLIRMLLEDMLGDLGYEIAGAVGTIAEASELAAKGDFNLAILDVNLDGK